MCTYKIDTNLIKYYYLMNTILMLGCGHDFQPGSRIDTPRLLALQADAPFARPGETVALTLLAPNPHHVPLEWAYGTCTLPPSSTVDDCLEHLDGDLEPFDLEDGPPSLTVPEDILEGLSDGEKASALIGAVIVACPGTLEPGATASVPTRCLDANGAALPVTELEVGIKRIFIRAHDRNENPAIERVLWDGEPWPETEPREAVNCAKDTYAIDDCAESLQHRIAVEVTPSERGRDELGAAFEEQTIVQFYSTHGVFRDQVRIAEDADNRWVAQFGDEADDSDEATLWLIARDDRGGVSWTTRSVRLRTK